MIPGPPILGLAFVLSGVTFIGYCVVRLFAADLSAMERIAWGFATGLLLHAALYGTLIALQASPGPKKLLMGQGLLVIALGIAQKWKRPSLPAPLVGECRPHSPRPGLFLAAAGVGVSLVAALAEPMWTTDYLAVWGLKGKTIYFTASLPSRLFHDPSLFWAQPEYPLLLPLLFASLSASVGQWNDRALALLYPACQAATMLLAYGFLSRRISPKAGGVAAVLIAIFFPLYAPVHAGMAEIPLAFGLVLLSTAFLDATANGSGRVSWRLALAALFCAALKPEGSLYVLLLLSALFLKPRRSNAIALALPLLLPALAHWGLLRLLRGPVSDRDIAWSLLRPERWKELAGRVGEVCGQLLQLGTSRAVVPMIGIFVLFLLTRPVPADRLLLPLALQTAFYAAVCVLSAHGAVWWFETSFLRITSALFPVLALVLAARLPHEASGTSARFFRPAEL